MIVEKLVTCLYFQCIQQNLKTFQPLISMHVYTFIYTFTNLITHTPEYAHTDLSTHSQIRRHTHISEHVYMDFNMHCTHTEIHTCEIRYTQMLQ